VDKIELKLGDTVFVEDREYVIMALDAMVDLHGRSLAIQAKDPMIAAQMMRNLKAQHASTDSQIAFSELNIPEQMKTLLQELHDQLNEDDEDEREHPGPRTD
jgi:hypothetical protein